MELAIVKYLKTHGLEKTLGDFNLKSNDYGHKVVIKYSMTESPMHCPEVQDARGLVLVKDTWEVMSMSFRKFFNAAEEKAATIDWGSAHILEKLDGTMIHVYWDWIIEKWCVATTGTAEAEGEVNNKNGTTFADLLWNTLKLMDADIWDKFGNVSLIKGHSHIFELCTPYNIVVTPHEKSFANYLSIRRLEDLKELNRSTLETMGQKYNIPIVKSFDLNATNVGHLNKTFADMPYIEEGYVVVDDAFNRIKVKNPAYVAVHHLKSSTAEYNICEIVKTNEIEEFGATFPERREEIIKLKENFDQLTIDLNGAWTELKNNLPKNITPKEKKKYAIKVFEVAERLNLKAHTSLYFSLKDRKVESVEDYLMNMDNRKLYDLL